MERSQSSNKKETIIMAKYTLKSNPNLPGNGEILYFQGVTKENQSVFVVPGMACQGRGFTRH